MIIRNIILTALLLLNVTKALQAQSAIQPSLYLRDVNKDGYIDLWLEKYSYDKRLNSNTNKYKTMVYLFYGSKMGIGNVPDTAFFIEKNFDAMPQKRHTDVTGDGLPDSVIIHESEVSVYFGRSNGFYSTPGCTYTLPIPADKKRDIYFYDYNGDKVADLIACSYYTTSSISAVIKTGIHWQVITGQLSENSKQKIELPELNENDVSILKDFDFNNDGLEDLFLTYTDASLHQNNVLWLGIKDAVPEKILWKRLQLSILGSRDNRFHHIGDINGDGFSDLLQLQRLSKRDARKQRTTPVALLIFKGYFGGLSDTPYYVRPLPECSPFSFYGLNVLSGFDIDGDGLQDAMLSTGEGNAIVVWGGTESPTSASFKLSNQLKSPPLGRYFNMSATDLNNDGLSDVLFYNEKDIYILYGSETRLLQPIGLQLQSATLKLQNPEF